MAQLQRLVDFTSERFNISPKYARYVAFGSFMIPAVVWLTDRLIACRRRHVFKQKALNYVKDLSTQIEQVQMICESKIMEERAVEITSLPFEDLQSKLHNGELLCVDVLYAYQRVAFRKNEEMNFIVQPVLEAEEMARKLDSLKPEERRKLALFGIPISVKENFQMAGYSSTAGCSQFLDLKRNKTSGLVQGLVNAGAVPFIRTNLAQTMMSLGSHNPIFGQSRNPHDLSRSPGGSSCGEASAVGSGASLIGIGSDIGGSIRVPGAWCGIYGLKPTAGRFSVMNQTSGVYGQTAVKGTGGFMARDLSSVVEFTRVVSSDAQFDADQSIPRIYFHEEDYTSTKPLTIGYIYEWPPIAVTESSKHAISKVLAGLSAQGHKVVQWSLPEFEDIPSRFYLQSLFGDGGAQLVESLKDDEVSYAIRTLVTILRIPAWIKRKLASTIGWAIPPWWTYKFLVGLSGAENVDKWFRLQTKVNKYRQLWIDDWRRQGIDVLILPAVPVPAEFIDEKRGCSSGCGGYAFPLNLVNFPAGVVPFGKITKEDEANDFSSYPEFDVMHRRLKEMIPGSAGLPLSIQCVALPYREEICLRAMNLVSQISQA